MRSWWRASDDGGRGSCRVFWWFVGWKYEGVFVTPSVTVRCGDGADPFTAVSMSALGSSLVDYVKTLTRLQDFAAAHASRPVAPASLAVAAAAALAPTAGAGDADVVVVEPAPTPSTVPAVPEPSSAAAAPSGEDVVAVMQVQRCTCLYVCMRVWLSLCVPVGGRGPGDWIVSVALGLFWFSPDVS